MSQPWHLPAQTNDDFTWGLLLALIAKAGGEVTLSRADPAPGKIGDREGRWYGIEGIPGGEPGDELVTFRIVKPRTNTLEEVEPIIPS
jgi:hypothetical protein